MSFCVESYYACHWRCMHINLNVIAASTYLNPLNFEGTVYYLKDPLKLKSAT